VRLAIDDFGTGHSCLSYLRQFPIDVLKIDRSFVADIGDDNHGEAICGLVLSIARSLNLEVVAEGVETEAQYSYLKSNGCNLAQGSRYSMPVWAGEIEAVLTRLGLEAAEPPTLESTAIMRAWAGTN